MPREQPEYQSKQDGTQDNTDQALDDRSSEASDSERMSPNASDSDVRSSTSETSEDETDQSRYLVGLEYDDRAERRRVEYRLENWDGTVQQVPRMTRIVEGDGFYELFDELQETVDNPEHLSVYNLDDITPSTKHRTVQIDRVYDVELEKLEWAVESLLNKRTASQVDESTYDLRPDASSNKVTFEFDLMAVQHGGRMTLTVTGPTPAPNAVKDAMLRDLGYLLPKPEEVFN